MYIHISDELFFSLFEYANIEDSIYEKMERRSFLKLIKTSFLKILVKSQFTFILKRLGIYFLFYF